VRLYQRADGGKLMPSVALTLDKVNWKSLVTLETY